MKGLMENCSENRLSAVAALAVLEGGQEALSLSEYMAQEDETVFNELVNSYAKEPDCEKKMGSILRQMAASQKFSSLAEIHPAWILEKLAQETPRVVGIILRYLPSKHVRFIIKNLPPMLVAQIPNMVESFNVSNEVLEVIKGRFEAHFLPMRVTRNVNKLGFEHIYYLKSEEIDEAIRDVGLGVLAIALSTMPGKTLVTVYNRLDLKDAKRLQKRIKGLNHISSNMVRQARRIVFEVEDERMGPEKMLSRIGIAMLAIALSDTEDTFCRLIGQRLAPYEGYLLARLVDEKRMQSVAPICHEAKGMFIASIVALSGEGRVDSTWKRFEENAIAGQLA